MSKIIVKKSCGYVVSYFDKDRRKIGYSTCSESDLVKTIEQTYFLGQKVCSVEWRAL